MSMYSPYYNTLAALETENAIKRSQVSAEINGCKIIADVKISHKQPQYEQVRGNRRSNTNYSSEDRIIAENAERRTRIHSQLKASRQETQVASRRSRVAAEISADRIITENAHKNQRMEAQMMATQTAVHYKIQTQIAAQIAFRRSKVDAQMETLRRMHNHYN